LAWEARSLIGDLSVTVSAGSIQEIYVLLNPEKLAYLQRQLSSA
jgi:hypothetical protein